MQGCVAETRCPVAQRLMRPVACAVGAVVFLGTPVAVATAADPIRIEAGGQGGRHRGFFDRLSSEDEDLDLSDRDIERALRGRRWLEVVRRDPEVTIDATRRFLSEASRSKPKNGKVRITWRYTVRAVVATGSDRGRLDATTTSSETVPESDSDRIRYEEHRDRDVFRRLAREIAEKANDWILDRIDRLRPNRPDAGFRHKARYRWLVKGDGLEVTKVLPGSPAARAGLGVGDRIRAIDKEKGTAQMDLRARTWWIEPAGTTVTLEVERKKKRRRLQCAILPPDQWRTSTSDRKSGSDRRTDAPLRLKAGMPPEQVESVLGRPLRIVSLGSKSVWTYDGVKVVFVGGRSPRSSRNAFGERSLEIATNTRDLGIDLASFENAAVTRNQDSGGEPLDAVEGEKPLPPRCWSSGLEGGSIVADHRVSRIEDALGNDPDREIGGGVSRHQQNVSAQAAQPELLLALDADVRRGDARSRKRDLAFVC